MTLMFRTCLFHEVRKFSFYFDPRGLEIVPNGQRSLVSENILVLVQRLPRCKFSSFWSI